MKRGISPRYNSGRNNGVCKIRIRFPFIPVSVTPILSKIAIPVRLSARFVERIMHRAAAINEIFLELNRADDKIITVRYCMNKRWLGRAIVSNRERSRISSSRNDRNMEIGTDRSVTYNCIFFFLLFPPFFFSPLPPPPLSLFLPQFRWIFIATVTIDLVEEFLLHLIWTLTGNDSIVWHERSLIAIALPCYADLIRPFFSPDANEDGLGTSRAIYLADASHLNFLDYYLIS